MTYWGKESKRDGIDQNRQRQGRGCKHPKVARYAVTQIVPGRGLRACEVCLRCKAVFVLGLPRRDGPH